MYENMKFLQISKILCYIFKLIPYSYISKKFQIQQKIMHIDLEIEKSKTIVLFAIYHKYIFVHYSHINIKDKFLITKGRKKEKCCI